MYDWLIQVCALANRQGLGSGCLNPALIWKRLDTLAGATPAATSDNLCG